MNARLTRLVLLLALVALVAAGCAPKSRIHRSRLP